VVAVALILVAATGRIIGLPLVAAIILALVVGLVIRRSLLRRRERRITIPKALALAAMMLGLVATAWSYTGALTDPGSAPVADRTANWMRDHHMNIIVDTIEQRLYSGNTSTGVVDRASLPNTPTAAPVSAAALPTAAASSSPPRTPSIKAPAVNPSTTAAGSTTTTAPPDRKPPTAGPLIDATLLGEGHWTPNPREVNGAPVSYTTFVRPDPDDRGVVAAAVVLEPSATKLVYVPGTKQPGGSGWLWKSGIPNA